MSFLINSVWILLLLQSAGPAKEEKKKKSKKDKKPQTEIKMRGHIPDKLKISSDKGTKEHSDGMVVSGKYLLLELHSPKMHLLLKRNNFFCLSWKVENNSGKHCLQGINI